MVSEFLAKLIVTVAVAEFEPFSVSVVGETVHLDVEGPPVHVRGTFPMNPPMGTKLSVKTADFAIEIVRDVGVAEMVKSPTGAAMAKVTAASSLTVEPVWLVARSEALPIAPLFTDGGILTGIVNCR